MLKQQWEFVKSDIEVSGQKMLPSKRLDYIGGGGFKAIGNEFFRYFTEYANLQKTDRVLDIGCGLGRMAVPLTGYLTGDTEYHGVDVVQKGIKWCNKNISSEFPNFYFHLLDVKNPFYREKGESAAHYKLPFEDRSFDFICLNSVFTHMQIDEMENYLREVSRLLKPNGKCLVTYFLLNPESEELINAGKATHQFEHLKGEMKLQNPSVPEEAVAYYERYVLNQFEETGLEIRYPIYYGNWCKRQNPVGYQDKIVAYKKHQAT